MGQLEDPGPRMRDQPRLEPAGVFLHRELHVADVGARFARWTRPPGGSVAVENRNDLSKQWRVRLIKGLRLQLDRALRFSQPFASAETPIDSGLHNAENRYLVVVPPKPLF